MLFEIIPHQSLLNVSTSETRYTRLKIKTSHLLGIFITSGYFRENPKIKMTSTLYLQLLKEAGDVI